MSYKFVYDYPESNLKLDDKIIRCCNRINHGDKNYPPNNYGAKPDLISSIGINPSQIIMSGLAPSQPIPPAAPTDNIKINFNNVYVNKGNNNTETPYDIVRGGYIVLDEGIFEIDINVNLFLLVLGFESQLPAIPLGPPVQLTNLVRYTLSVWAQKTTGQRVQLASKNGLFNRTESLLLENNRSFYAINDVQANSMTFMIDTNEGKQHNISVGDLIYATIKINTFPVGNYRSYNISVTSSGQGEDKTISASFFNIKRISN